MPMNQLILCHHLLELRLVPINRHKTTASGKAILQWRNLRLHQIEATITWGITQFQPNFIHLYRKLLIRLMIIKYINHANESNHLFSPCTLCHHLLELSLTLSFGQMHCTTSGWVQFTCIQSINHLSLKRGKKRNWQVQLRLGFHHNWSTTPYTQQEDKLLSEINNKQFLGNSKLANT